MKKIASFICAMFLFLQFFPVSAEAATNATYAGDIIYLENGYYITIECSTIATRATSTKTGSKTYVCRASDGTEEWRAVLSGTFTYTGSSATCTASSCSVSITNTNWYVISKTASKSGNTATAELTMGRKLLGITIDKDTISMQLTCSASGTLS